MLDIPSLSVYKSTKQFGFSFALDVPQIWKGLPEILHLFQLWESMSLHQSLPTLIFNWWWHFLRCGPGSGINVWYPDYVTGCCTLGLSLWQRVNTINLWLNWDKPPWVTCLSSSSAHNYLRQNKLQCCEKVSIPHQETSVYITITTKVIYWKLKLYVYVGDIKPSLY